MRGFLHRRSCSVNVSKAVITRSLLRAKVIRHSDWRIRSFCASTKPREGSAFLRACLNSALGNGHCLNSSRISTSKMKDFKPRDMSTYEKMGPLLARKKSTFLREEATNRMRFSRLTKLSFCALNKTGSAPPSAAFTATRHSLDAAAPNSVPSKFAFLSWGSELQL